MTFGIEHQLNVSVFNMCIQMNVDKTLSVCGWIDLVLVENKSIIEIKCFRNNMIHCVSSPAEAVLPVCKLNNNNTYK